MLTSTLVLLALLNCKKKYLKKSFLVDWKVSAKGPIYEPIVQTIIFSDFSLYPLISVGFIFFNFYGSEVRVVPDFRPFFISGPPRYPVSFAGYPVKLLI